MSVDVCEELRGSIQRLLEAGEANGLTVVGAAYASRSILSGLLAALLWPEVVDVTCSTCRGSQDWFFRRFPCHSCGGRGYVSVRRDTVTT